MLFSEFFFFFRGVGSVLWRGKGGERRCEMVTGEMGGGKETGGGGEMKGGRWGWG